MTFFTSYAQNGEDVLLWRVLGHVKNGFYIDVGANDTEEHSVTKAFYERGWWGINIEPLPFYHQRFIEQRPRDINLMVAAGSSSAEITLYDVDDVHGWATLNPEIAAQHRKDGKEITESLVQVLPLNAICAEHVSSTIHFLKIDVEGFEESVLRGLDLERWRPWVLVVEATLPNSTETNHQAWEHLILAHRYQYAYFDGLNRYYVADEQASLVEKLALQPNVFDNFHNVHLVKAWAQRDKIFHDKVHDHEIFEAQRNEMATKFQQLAADHAQLVQQLSLSQQNLEREQLVRHFQVRSMDIAQQLVRAQWQFAEERLAIAKAELSDTRAQVQDLTKHVDALQNQNELLQRSTSWRVTKPLRAIKNLQIVSSQLLRRVVHVLVNPGILLAKFNSALRKALFAFGAKVLSVEKVRNLLAGFFLKYPNLLTRLRPYFMRTATPPDQHEPTAPELSCLEQPLSKQAVQIYRDLQRVRSKV